MLMNGSEAIVKLIIIVNSDMKETLGLKEKRMQGGENGANDSDFKYMIGCFDPAPQLDIL